MRLNLIRTAVGIVVCEVLLGGAAMGTPPTCTTADARLTEDYLHIVGSAGYVDADGDVESGSTFRWLVNGMPSPPEPAPQLFQLHFDDSAIGSGGETPTTAAGVAYGGGRWNSALVLAAGGSLAYARAGNLDLDEGTIEMWVAPRVAGHDPVYTNRAHYLFLYAAPNGDYVTVVQSGGSGVLYVGGSVGGQWQSAYNGAVTVLNWQAGAWHHVAYTFSVAGNFMRLYVDGVMVADTNEGFYLPPSPAGSEFLIGNDVWGNEAYYLLDEVRVFNRAASGDEIAASANRQQQPADFEAWLETGQLQDGDEVAFEFTPSDGVETGTPCVSAPVTYAAIPITSLEPPSTILPPNTSALALTVQTGENTACRYAVGSPLDFGGMTPFDSGEGTTQHETLIAGIDTDPNVVSEVYVRCAAEPDYLLHARYRCLSEADPDYPRTANLWGSWAFIPEGMAYCARIDLWLGAGFTADQIRELRQLNPDIRVLTSINAIENHGLPEDYYLHDISGNRIEVWPGSFRLNVTKPYVAEYQARYAAQRILDNDLMFDGCFFDNVMTTQSWATHDIFGNPFLYDYNEDGVVDDPGDLDAAWKAGVFHELDTFRTLMPHALMTGHSMYVQEPGIADIFNGIGVGFWTTDTIENKLSFDDLWERLQAWDTMPLEPHITMIESSPPDQISYGYDYSPWSHTPPSTLEFARTYYPYVRFGLAVTLMHDGFFAHEFGDTWHGNDWWYDELDFDLGYPAGPAVSVDLGEGPNEDLMVNGDFEAPIAWPWSLWVNTGAGCVASVSRDTRDFAEGSASARIDISATSGQDWHIDCAQFDRSLIEDTTYDVVFWAKADVDRTIRLSAQRGSAPWENFGLSRQVAIGTAWEEYTVSFTANATTSESRIEFLVGETTGSVWLDDVRVYEQRPYALTREFGNGLVVLNPTREPIEIPVGPGYRRLLGHQAPRYEYIVDDADVAFSVAGSWATVTYDSGEWQAAGPFYHDWGDACRASGGAPMDVARWDLTVQEADVYTITAWWPAALTAGTWSANVLFEVIAHGAVVASATLDQRVGGDEWHAVAEVALTPQDAAFVRVSSLDGLTCIADALHVRSAARYNDGSPTSLVILAPMDGIVLGRFSADFDDDGDVDADDFDLFAACFTGSGGGPVAPACEAADFDGDQDVDCDDWQQFRLAWTGPPEEPPAFAPCRGGGIPTVSEWGLVVMALLLLGAASIALKPATSS